MLLFDNVNSGGLEQGASTSMARLAQSVNNGSSQRFAMRNAMQAAMAKAFRIKANNDQAG